MLLSHFKALKHPRTETALAIVLGLSSAFGLKYLAALYLIIWLLAGGQ